MTRGGTAHSEVTTIGYKEALILVRGLVAYTATHTRIEGRRGILAAPAPFLTLTIRMSETKDRTDEGGKED